MKLPNAAGVHWQQVNGRRERALVINVSHELPPVLQTATSGRQVSNQLQGEVS